MAPVDAKYGVLLFVIGLLSSITAYSDMFLGVISGSVNRNLFFLGACFALFGVIVFLRGRKK